MKASMELLVRGLLVLALGGYAIGCGDDSSSGSKGDAGPDSSVPVGGTGGKTMVDSGVDGGASAGMCVAATTTIVGDMLPADCVSCACTMAEKATIACDAMCWGLLGCIVDMCPDATTQAEITACATMKCAGFITGATGAMGIAPTLTGACMSTCRSSSSADGGTDTDAGN